MSISIAEFRSNLKKYLQQIRNGETVHVKDLYIKDVGFVQKGESVQKQEPKFVQKQESVQIPKPELVQMAKPSPESVYKSKIPFTSLDDGIVVYGDEWFNEAGNMIPPCDQCKEPAQYEQLADDGEHRICLKCIKAKTPQKLLVSTLRSFEKL